MTDHAEQAQRRDTKNRLMLHLREVPRDLVRGEESQDGHYLPHAIARKPERNAQVDEAIERLMDEGSVRFRDRDGQELDIHAAAEKLREYGEAHAATRMHRTAPKGEPERTGYEQAKAALRDLQKQVVNAVEAKRAEVAAEPATQNIRSR